MDALGPFRSLIRRVTAWCEGQSAQRVGEKERRILATVRDENGGGRETNRTRKNARPEDKKRDKETSRGKREKRLETRVAHTSDIDWVSEDAVGAGVSAVPATTVTRPANDCRRRGAPALHVTREIRISSSRRAGSWPVQGRCRRPGTCYEPRRAASSGGGWPTMP